MNQAVKIRYFRVDPETGYTIYDFDSLRHGDAINVASKPSAREMFRRWKRANNRHGRLVSASEDPDLMFFLDETPV